MEAPRLFQKRESGFFTCVRVRPPPVGEEVTAPEITVTSPETIELTKKTRHIRTGATRDSQPSSVFFVDAALDGSCSDDTMYACVLRPLVRKFARGQSVSIICYGQTGSGKTHTVAGLCARFPADLFRDVGLASRSGLGAGLLGAGLLGSSGGGSGELTATNNSPSPSPPVLMEMLKVQVEAVELLGNNCQDLLAVATAATADGDGGGDDGDGVPSHGVCGLSPTVSNSSVRIGEDGGGAGNELVLAGARSLTAATSDELADILQQAAQQRCMAATYRNDDSSRSHAVYRITLLRRRPPPQQRQQPGTTETATANAATASNKAPTWKATTRRTPTSKAAAKTGRPFLKKHSPATAPSKHRPSSSPSSPPTSPSSSTSDAWEVCGRLVVADLAGSERASDRQPPPPPQPQPLSQLQPPPKQLLVERERLGGESSSCGGGGGSSGGSSGGCSKERPKERPLSESIAINKSLSALRDCMRASDNAFNHSAGSGLSEARYRQNALTLLLKDAFAFGDSATLFVACLSPLPCDAAHSKSTLLYTKGVLDRQKEHSRATRTGGTSPSSTTGAATLSSSNSLPSLDPRRWPKQAAAYFIRELVKVFLEADRTTRSKPSSSNKPSKPSTSSSTGKASSTAKSSLSKTCSPSVPGQRFPSEMVAAFRVTGAQLCAFTAQDAVRRAGGGSVGEGGDSGNRSSGSSSSSSRNSRSSSQSINSSSGNNVSNNKSRNPTSSSPLPSPSSRAMAAATTTTQRHDFALLLVGCLELLVSQADLTRHDGGGGGVSAEVVVALARSTAPHLFTTPPPPLSSSKPSSSPSTNVDGHLGVGAASASLPLSPPPSSSSSSSPDKAPPPPSSPPPLSSSPWSRTVKPLSATSTPLTPHRRGPQPSTGLTNNTAMKVFGSPDVSALQHLCDLLLRLRFSSTQPGTAPAAIATASPTIAVAAVAAGPSNAATTSEAATAEAAVAPPSGTPSLESTWLANTAELEASLELAWRQLKAVHDLALTADKALKNQKSKRKAAMARHSRALSSIFADAVEQLHKLHDSLRTLAPALRASSSLTSSTLVEGATATSSTASTLVVADEEEEAVLRSELAMLKEWAETHSDHYDFSFTDITLVAPTSCEPSSSLVSATSAAAVITSMAVPTAGASPLLSTTMKHDDGDLPLPSLSCIEEAFTSLSRVKELLFPFLQPLPPPLPPPPAEAAGTVQQTEKTATTAGAPAPATVPAAAVDAGAEAAETAAKEASGSWEKAVSGVAAVEARQELYRRRAAQAKVFEGSFEAHRESLEELSARLLSGAKRRRDDGCEALLRTREEEEKKKLAVALAAIQEHGGSGGNGSGSGSDGCSSGGGGGGSDERRAGGNHGNVDEDGRALDVFSFSSEVEALVGEYEATKQSWEDFWGAR